MNSKGVKMLGEGITGLPLLNGAVLRMASEHHKIRYKQSHVSLTAHQQLLDKSYSDTRRHCKHRCEPPSFRTNLSFKIRFADVSHPLNLGVVAGNQYFRIHQKDATLLGGV